MVFKKIVLFLLPVLLIFGFVRTTFGNEIFLEDWTTIVSKASTIPDLPTQLTEEVKTIQESWDNVGTEWENFNKWLDKYEEIKEEPTPDEFWEQVGFFFKMVGSALMVLVGGLGDILFVIPRFFIVVGNVFWLLFDGFMLPFRYIVWALTQFILPT